MEKVLKFLIMEISFMKAIGKTDRKMDGGDFSIQMKIITIQKMMMIFNYQIISFMKVHG